MALPTSGVMSSAMIRDEFGQSNPVALGDYTRGGIVPNNTTNIKIKTTKANMALSDYYGAANIIKFTCYQNLNVTSFGEWGGSYSSSKDTGFLTAADLTGRGSKILIAGGGAYDSCRAGSVSYTYYAETIDTPGAAVVRTNYSGIEAAAALYALGGKLFILHSSDAPVSYFWSLLGWQGDHPSSGCDVTLDGTAFDATKFKQVHQARLYFYAWQNKSGNCYGGINSRTGVMEFV